MQRALALLPALIFLHLFAAFITPHDPDLGYHLTIGNHILDRGAFPEQDLFRIDSSEPEIAYSWLPDITLALAEKYGGTLGLRLWIILGIFSISLLACAICFEKQSLLVSAVFLALLAFSLFQICGPRPRLISTALFAALLLALRSDTFSDTHRGFLFRSAIVLLLVVLWANTHISVFIAPGMVLAIGLGATLQGTTCYSLPRTIALCVASTFVIALNPYHFHLFDTAQNFSPLLGRALSSRILELASLRELPPPWPIWVWSNLGLFLLWFMALLFFGWKAVSALGKHDLPNSRPGLRAAFYQFFRSLPPDFLGGSALTVLFAIMSYQSTRHASFFALAALFSLCVGSCRYHLKKVIYPIVGITLFLLATIVGLRQSSWNAPWFEGDVADLFYPRQALDGARPLLTQAESSPQRIRILAPFENGHFTTWWLSQQQLLSVAGVILDGRIDQLGKERFFPIFDAYRGVCWKETAEFFDVDIFLVKQNNEAFQEIAADADWIPISGGQIVAFVRRSWVENML